LLAVLAAAAAAATTTETSDTSQLVLYCQPNTTTTAPSELCGQHYPTCGWSEACACIGLQQTIQVASDLFLTSYNTTTNSSMPYSSIAIYALAGSFNAPTDCSIVLPDLPIYLTSLNGSHATSIDCHDRATAVMAMGGTTYQQHITGFTFNGINNSVAIQISQGQCGRVGLQVADLMPNIRCLDGQIVNWYRSMTAMWQRVHLNRASLQTITHCCVLIVVGSTVPEVGCSTCPIQTKQRYVPDDRIGLDRIG
jgi:hypothetical protein